MDATIDSCLKGAYIDDMPVLPAMLEADAGAIIQGLLDRRKGAESKGPPTAPPSGASKGLPSPSKRNWRHERAGPRHQSRQRRNRWWTTTDDPQPAHRARAHDGPQTTSPRAITWMLSRPDHL